MTDAAIPVEQRGFDPLGPEVRRAHLSTGRSVHYIDDGHPDRCTLLFFGGGGTSVRAFRLLEFARTLRIQLGIRVVSVERNGLGDTPYDPELGLGEHAEDVWALLDDLGVEQASLVAISGGGPYAAHVAAARPSRVRSLHISCAVSERLEMAERRLSVAEIAADPVAWWRYPPTSPVHRIPGYVDSTVEEATRSMFARGRDTAPQGLAQAIEFYAHMPMADVSHVDAPAFLYWGSDDPVVPVAHLDRWAAALPTEPKVRLYEGEGHDVQYRHWDQILTDVAYLGERVITTVRGRTQLVRADQATELIATKQATLGLAAWA